MNNIVAINLILTVINITVYAMFQNPIQLFALGLSIGVAICSITEVKEEDD